MGLSLVSTMSILARYLEGSGIPSKLFLLLPPSAVAEAEVSSQLYRVMASDTLYTEPAVDSAQIRTLVVGDHAIVLVQHVRSVHIAPASS